MASALNAGISHPFDLLPISSPFLPFTVSLKISLLLLHVLVPTKRFNLRLGIGITTIESVEMLGCSQPFLPSVGVLFTLSTPLSILYISLWPLPVSPQFDPNYFIHAYFCLSFASLSKQRTAFHDCILLKAA